MKRGIKNISLVLLWAGAVAWQGCTTEEETGPSSTLAFTISYQVDGLPLLFDTLLYTNDAGNPYSVYKLEYFLTQISLVRLDGSEVIVKDYQYLSAGDPATNHFVIENVPEGNFYGIRFNIGVDPAHNVTGGLPNTEDNNNMEWPVPMGGGYHHMKLEGHFMLHDTLYGFAMHLGKNENLVKVKIMSPVAINHSNVNYGMVMNLNEWFRNPSVYDFNTDGNYSMSDTLAMHKLSANGTDVFTRD